MNLVSWICCEASSPIPVNLTNDGKEIIIGRYRSCDLRLVHNSVSRRHASISVDNKKLFIRDLHSSNGTYLNGKKLFDEKELAVDDSIQIGPFEIHLRDRPYDDEDDHNKATSTEYLTRSKTACLSGQLKKTPLPEILQSIEFNKKTGTLYLEAKNADGFFTFTQGKPISAVFGDFQDEEAILQMLSLEEGCFVLMDKIERITGGIHKSITAILMEFSRQLDKSGVS